MRNRFKMNILIAVLMAINLAIVTTANANTGLKIPFRLIALDVGEGQSILLKRGPHGILIDTGHAGKALYLLKQLRTYGVQQLDYLILTHLHPDHASGYFRIREAFPNIPVLVHDFSVINSSVPDMSRWVAAALESDPYRRQFRVGNQFNWQGLIITPLWPGDSPGANMNDSSLVIEVIFGSRRVLLMGDVGSKIEQELMNQNSLSGAYDVLVAGHHGSSDTSGNAFLEKVNPAYSIVSINADNLRGYPASETLERLDRHSRLGLFKTFADGDICLEWASESSLPVRCLNP